MEKVLSFKRRIKMKTEQEVIEEMERLKKDKIKRSNYLKKKREDEMKDVEWLSINARYWGLNWVLTHE